MDVSSTHKPRLMGEELRADGQMREEDTERRSKKRNGFEGQACFIGK